MIAMEQPAEQGGKTLATGRSRRWLELKDSPLARRIVGFNLLVILIMMAGIILLNPFRATLLEQRERGLLAEARLVAAICDGAPQGGAAGCASFDPARLAAGVVLRIYGPSGVLLTTYIGGSDADLLPGEASWPTPGGLISGFFPPFTPLDEAEFLASEIVPAVLAGQIRVTSLHSQTGGTTVLAAVPLRANAGAIAMASSAGEIDLHVRKEREKILLIFGLGLIVSVGLSLMLASAIAQPLRNLAAAAEHGRAGDGRKMAPGRVRIPDLTGRGDEIGQLSVAMRGMVAALYDRIDSNEQFAADVSHEIKNPLASLRSAVASLHVAGRDDQRARLMEVIDHDVRRLDRLVTDISNASRLDSELVKEEEEEFSLLRTITRLTDHLGQQASSQGIEFITDLPDEPVMIRGLEGRLAQVFVNLISNAISFCEEGDAVRVWARKRDNRVLVVVEDTGPGIPEAALTRIFDRFYSERAQGDFGNHSGLGLAISKQIVEAHGGVIWAENIRPTHADITSEPLGARFVVGLPV